MIELEHRDEEANGKGKKKDETDHPRAQIEPPIAAPSCRIVYPEIGADARATLGSPTSTPTEKSLLFFMFLKALDISRDKIVTRTLVVV